MLDQAINRELTVRHLDAIVVGAGFAGLYVLHRLRGMGLTRPGVRAGRRRRRHLVLEPLPRRALRHRVVSTTRYSFSEELEQEWDWTERYPTEPEILRYLNHVADRFDLRRDIQLNTRVTGASYDEARGRWQVVTDGRRAVSPRGTA